MRVFIGRFLWYFYKGCFAPFTPHACRFYPTCSVYAREIFERDGIRGVPRIVSRVLRCNPWGGSGYDPVGVDAVRREAVETPLPEVEAGSRTKLDSYH